MQDRNGASVRVSSVVLILALLTGCATDEPPGEPSAAEGDPGELACRSDLRNMGILDYGSDVQGRPGPPAAVVREWFGQLLGERSLRTLGPTTVAVTEAGRTVAVIELLPVGDNEFVVQDYEGCPGEITFP